MLSFSTGYEPTMSPLPLLKHLFRLERVCCMYPDLVRQNTIAFIPEIKFELLLVFLCEIVFSLYLILNQL